MLPLDVKAPIMGTTATASSDTHDCQSKSERELEDSQLCLHLPNSIQFCGPELPCEKMFDAIGYKLVVNRGTLKRERGRSRTERLFFWFLGVS